MNGVDPKACMCALGHIDDGFVFEDFAKNFLSGRLGYSFVPAGGIRDKGIDGLDHVFNQEGNQKVIYQFSIEKDGEGKASGSVKLLKDNNIKFDRFTYVTNQEIKDKDKLIDELADKHKKPMQVYDLLWFGANVNNSPATVNAYEVFKNNYLHEFQKPGAGFEIGDLVSDPRLYVFLRQQWDMRKDALNLDQVLADTLILYALEGTDPDENILKNREEIIKEIGKYLKFQPKVLTSQIDDRLQILSSKPERKIKYHTKDNGYCLPYETRKELTDKNLRDLALHKSFRESIVPELKKYLRTDDVRIQDAVSLINETLNKLFYRQGLEFSDLVSTGHSKEAFEKDLYGTISEVVDESRVILKNKQSVKKALLLTIRNLVYHGTTEQKEYLKCLANTYMLLFLLQCEPKVSLFFTQMASKLDVYVCTSILIPALSEICLDEQNRRYWNLLSGAKAAGVKLRINETILNELAAHIKKIINNYEEEFKDSEELYDDDITIIYIKEILIRAYFYSKLKNNISTFNDFIDKFCNPTLANLNRDLLLCLQENFGVEFVPLESTGINIDKTELTQLTTALEQEKRDKHRASNDAKLILTIFALREKNREMSHQNWSGYRTWWLSSDKVTHRTVCQVFSNKYSVSCYMRPDFLYNYISLAPHTEVIKEVYQNIFPNLLGVNISHSLPDEVINSVRSFINEHQAKDKGRMKGILSDLSDKLITDPNYSSRERVNLFLENQKKQFTLSN
ncbi:MAG: hypothetical protein MRJ96_06970 [Nitrospirales bacterium]|nr:hypothetical protein [Nitrospirales bacterium]